MEPPVLIHSGRRRGGAHGGCARRYGSRVALGLLLIVDLAQGAAAHCLRPGSTTVGSAGHGRYCIDVNSSVNDGAKLVVQLEMPRALDVVRIGSTTLLHSPRNTSSHGGAIIEASIDAFWIGGAVAARELAPTGAIALLEDQQAHGFGPWIRLLQRSS